MVNKEEHTPYKIEKIKDEAKDVRTFLLDVRENPIIAAPGEFFMIWLPGVSENPFSISYCWTDGVGITVRKVGDENSFTSKLFELNIGDKLWIRGPYGRSFSIPPIGKDSYYRNRYIVAGGTGAIPLALLSQYIGNNKPPIVLLGAKTKDEIIFEDRFRKYSEKLLISTDDGSYGYKGFVTDLFDQIEIEPRSIFHICGPEKMMVVAAEKAAKYVDQEAIQLSLERYMKCGQGVCGSCEVNGYRVCIDGPVFSYSQIRGGDFGKYKRDRSGKKVEI